MYQHDPRHVDVLVKDLGLEQGNTVPEKSWSRWTKFYTADTGRKLHDVCSSVKLDRHKIHRERVMSKGVKLHATDHCQVEKASRVFTRERQWRHIICSGRMVEDVTRFSDSDWAGCKETRKSSSAGVTLVGHTLKACTRKHNDHCKKQCRSRAECYSIGCVRVKRNCVVVEGSGLRDEASVGH